MHRSNNVQRQSQTSKQRSHRIKSNSYDPFSEHQLIKPTASSSSSTISVSSTIPYKTLAEELDEALSIIQNNPQNSTGYLLAGKLYSCQGNQQEAISVLEQCPLLRPGTQQEQPAIDNDECSLLIRQQVDIVKARLERRIDFLTDCPYEIMCNIINYIVVDIFSATTTVIQCLDVCRSWRRVFLNFTPAWKILTLNGSFTSGDGKRKLTQSMAATSGLVESIRIFGSPEKIKKYYGWIKTNGITNLRSLTVTDTDQDINADVILTHPTYSTLSVIGNTLTHLKLVSQSLIGVSLGQILSFCPNLISIKLDVYSFDGVHFAGRTGITVLPFDMVSLTRMEITSHILNVPLDTTVGPLLPQLPRLKHLILLYNTCYRYDSADILTVLNDEHCPELVELQTNTMETSNGPFSLAEQDDDEGNDNNDDLRVATFVNKKGEEGLSRLVLHNIHTATSLRSRLERSCNSLHTMSLTLRIIYSHYYTPPVIDWSPLSSFTMHKMSTFHVSNNCLPFYEHLPAILRCFPVLETLYLEKATIDPELANDLLDSIFCLSKLSTLEMHHMDVPVDGFFDRLLEHFVMVTQQHEQHATKNASTSNICITGNCGSRKRQQQPLYTGLKCLRIVQCNRITASTLQICGKIKSLRTLGIDLRLCSNNITRTITASDVEQFAATALMENHLPVLLDLELGNMILTDKAVESIIAAHKDNNLETLTLNGIQKLSRQSMKLLEKNIETFSIT